MVFERVWVGTVLLCTGLLSAYAQRPDNVNTTFVIDSHQVKVDDGLTRVSGRLNSKPHTSSRIDSVSVVNSLGCRYLAFDIDGVDFKRYFQWEEDGSITLELDFPTTDIAPGDTLTIYTIRGNVVSVIK